MPGTHKNHFIPCFYSKHWTGADGRLCEYTRPYQSVVPRKTFPRGTGYKLDIYTEPALPPEQQTHLEDVVMKYIDQQACDALGFIRANKMSAMSDELKIGWVRFLMSLLQRSPGKMLELARKWEDQLAKPDGALQARYEQRRRPQDPESFQDFMRLHPARLARGRLNAVQRVMNLPKVGTGILNMHWGVIGVRDSRFAFLTSDRPIIMTNGLKQEMGHIALAIGPEQLFVAANQIGTIDYIANMTPRELVQRCNELVVGQAEDQVYGRTDRELLFVERRLRKNKPSPQTENIQALSLENPADGFGKPISQPSDTFGNPKKNNEMMVPRDRIELPTRGFSIHCSTD